MQFEFIEMNDVQKQTRVLHVMYGVNCGGVEATVYNYYRKMNRSKFHFDVVSQKDRNQDVSTDLFAQKFRDLGSNVYYIPSKQDNFCSCMYGFAKILRKTSYDIVHIHMGQGSLPYVVCAKLLGITHIVVHTHIAFDKSGWSTSMTTHIMGLLLRLFRTQKMACSKEAAEEIWAKEQVFVLNNAVDFENYTPNEYKRRELRKTLGIEGNYTLCAVARFVPSKNHMALIDIFAKYTILDPSARLLLVGTGELQQEIEEKVRTLQLTDRVTFMGARKDVPDILQAADAFVLPSIFEGFGIVYLEAQLAGLPTFAVRDAIPDSVCISDGFYLIHPNATSEQWAEKIKMSRKRTVNIQKTIERARNNGFDLNVEARKLEEFYDNIISAGVSR